MMKHSKQANFFIHPDDWPEILSFNISQGVIMVEVNAELNSIFQSRDHNFKHQVYLTTLEFLNDGLVNLHEKYYYLDVAKSYVIQFTCGGFYPNSINTLNRARLYCNLSYWHLNEKIEKEKIFLDFTNSYFNEFNRKFLKKSEFNKDFRMSMQAIAWANLHQARLSDSALELIGS